MFEKPRQPAPAAKATAKRAFMAFMVARAAMWTMGKAAAVMRGVFGIIRMAGEMFE